MKQEEDMNSLGCIGNIHQKDTNDNDDEYYQTNVSELTLSENDGKTRKRTAVVDITRNVPTSKPKEGEKTTPFTTISWIIFFLLFLVVGSFIAFKTGENNKQVMTDIDDCANDPCLNEGECLDKISDYVCNCKRWYSGKNCEIVEACVNHKCQNGGSCIGQLNGDYKCACSKYLEGKFCEIRHKGF